MACALTPPINDDPKVDDAFTEKTDFYDEFLTRKLGNKDELQNARFISLNYDCLLERAICRRYEQPLDGGTQCLCSHVNYRLTEKAVGIVVLKPHGSINWVADTTLGDGCIEQGSSIPIVGTICEKLAMEWKTIDVVYSPEGHTDIVLAHYALNKIPQANPHLLENVRNLALQRVTEASSITLIGIHIPDNPFDDPFLHDLFTSMSRRAQNGLRVNYINPVQSELAKASSLSFKSIEKRFQEYVGVIP